MSFQKFIEQSVSAIKNPKVRGRIYLITLLMSLFILAITIKGPANTGSLISDDSGAIMKIQRSSMENSETYEMILDIRDGNKISQRPVTLVLRPYSNTKNLKETNPEEVRSAEINTQIDGIITSIEYSPDEELVLPTRLDDGTTISWHAAESKSNEGFVIIPIIYFALIALTIKSQVDADGGKEIAIRKEILHDLPRFCNQLFLMMNAGMILSDAFERICSSYLEIKEDERSWFQKEMITLYKQNCDHHRGAAVVLTEFAAEYNVKELTRIAAILAVNEKRGSDVVESLSRESKYLWDDRKLIAREGGKQIDVKMSYPLGALLILLIVITMAPAMLNI